MVGVDIGFENPLKSLAVRRPNFDPGRSAVIVDTIDSMFPLYRLPRPSSPVQPIFFMRVQPGDGTDDDRLDAVGEASGKTLMNGTGCGDDGDDLDAGDDGCGLGVQRISGDDDGESSSRRWWRKW